MKEDEADFDEVEVVVDDEGEFDENDVIDGEFGDVEVEVESDVEVEVEDEAEDEAGEADTVTSLVETYRAWNDEELAGAIHDRLDTLYANRSDIHEETMCVLNTPKSATGSHTKSHSSHQRAATTTKRCRGTKARGGDYE